MIKYSIRRILLTIPLLLVVLSLVFVFVRLAPGDPAMAILGQYATQESLDALREEMGLNAPMWLQYLRFLGNSQDLRAANSQEIADIEAT